MSVKKGLTELDIARERLARSRVRLHRQFRTPFAAAGGFSRSWRGLAVQGARALSGNSSGFGVGTNLALAVAALIAVLLRRRTWGITAKAVGVELAVPLLLAALRFSKSRS
ncbi:MAG: hypothetical protein LBE59_11185 [Nevskiaceae bacterium]|jgi:uncharacterized protein (TIGR03382 family)|nr:hypothetical protein [Nevskiaceae bacterium]